MWWLTIVGFFVIIVTSSDGKTLFDAVANVKDRRVGKALNSPPLDQDVTAEMVEVGSSDVEETCTLEVEDLSARLWRTRREEVIMTLSSEMATCQPKSVCSLWTTTPVNDAGSVKVHQVEIQTGDELILRIGPKLPGCSGEETGNGSKIYVKVAPTTAEVLQAKDFYFDIEATVKQWMIAKQEDLALGPELLTHGIHPLAILARDPDRQCETLWRLNITVRGHECYKSDPHEPCSEKGQCIADSSKITFTCQCCPGYIGRYCEERNGCHGNPCQHGGFCVDISEGLGGATFQCLCPRGFRGQSCEEEVNLCDRRPCQNNGTCRGNQTAYWCDCPVGFAGKDCETNVNECLSNPCIHGVCEDGEGGYKCYCLPGYGGDHCEFEYDECDSSPCINGGACEDLVAGYRCHCGPGYQGRRCQIKVDLCRPNPCPTPAQCVDRGNNYSCICHPGYNGPGCTQHYDPCYPNPCQNGGSCWPSLDSFFCSCRPGFTGDTCEELLYPGRPLPHTLDDSLDEDGNAKLGPVSVPLDHLHNIYIAAATLAGACLIVVTVVAVCHCRVHKTYQRFTRKLSRSCSELKQQKFEDPGKFSLNLHGSASEVRPCTENWFEASSVDLGDSISAPLID